MIRSEPVDCIAAQNQRRYARDVERVVSAIRDRMAVALVDGDRVELHGFDAFTPRETQARTGRNLRPGVSVQVAAKTNVHFKPSTTMRTRFNRARIEPEEAERLLRAS